MKALSLLNQLLKDKQVVVPMSLMCTFLRVCEAAGVVCYGGAFSEDFNSQLFYL